MPRNSFTIAPLTQGASMEEINTRIRDINDAFERIALFESEFRGEDGFEPEFANDVNFKGKRVKNVKRSEAGTDAVNRDEVIELIKQELETERVDVKVEVSLLTDSTGGTANNTVQDVTASFNQTILNDNFADVVARVNSLVNAVELIIQELKRGE